MSSGWAEGIRARARAHWTEARLAQLRGDKSLAIDPVDGAPLLRALGLLDRHGALPAARVPKYLQINHMVALLGADVRRLGEVGRPLRVLDAGCGRSYLSLLLAWCARERWGLSLRVLGVDRQPHILASCARRTQLAGLDDVMRFRAADLGTLDAERAFADEFGQAGPPDIVLALHACDTATCDAIALGVRSQAQLIAVAPCCQAELARAWSALAAQGTQGDFAGIWSLPHLRRETAAQVTDAMRTLLLAAHGYSATALEFVPVEHTRKNTLIRGVRSSAADAEAQGAYAALKRATGGAGIALEALLSAPPVG